MLKNEPYWSSLISMVLVVVQLYAAFMGLVKLFISDTTKLQSVSRFSPACNSADVELIIVVDTLGETGNAGKLIPPDLFLLMWRLLHWFG